VLIIGIIIGIVIGIWVGWVLAYWWAMRGFGRYM
jgi:hypothetical protein